MFWLQNQPRFTEGMQSPFRKNHIWVRDCSKAPQTIRSASSFFGAFLCSHFGLSVKVFGKYDQFTLIYIAI